MNSYMPGYLVGRFVLIGMVLVVGALLVVPSVFGQCENYANYSYEAGYIETVGSAEGIYVQDQYAYLVDTSNRFQIFDVSDPLFPEMISSTGLSFTPTSIWVSGSIAAIAGDGVSLQLLDVSDQAAPFVLGSLNGGYLGKEVVIVGSLVNG